jgi:hypothetical protein
MIRICLLCVAMAVGWSCSVAAGAESSISASGGAWVAVGAGGGNVRGETENQLFNRFSLAMSWNIMWGPHLLSARYVRLGLSESDGDVALLYERIVKNSGYLLSVGLGPSLLYRTYGGGTDVPENETFNRAGIAWVVEVASRRNPAVGPGVMAFGELAGSRSFAGLAVVLQLGRLISIE